MCGGESADFHAFIEDAPYVWLSIEIATIKHLRTRHVWDETDVGKAGNVAVTEPTCSR
jgi:hypothetical protein